MFGGDELELERIRERLAGLERQSEGQLRQPPSGFRAVRCKVVTEANDYLTCKLYSSAAAWETADVLVAKPSALRGQTGFFAADDQILAVPVRGGTGVSAGTPSRALMLECITLVAYWVADP